MKPPSEINEYKYHYSEIFKYKYHYNLIFRSGNSDKVSVSSLPKKESSGGKNNAFLLLFLSKIICYIKGGVQDS